MGVILVLVERSLGERDGGAPNREVKSVDPRSTCTGIFGAGEGLRVGREAACCLAAPVLTFREASVFVVSTFFGRYSLLGFEASFPGLSEALARVLVLSTPFRGP